MADHKQIITDLAAIQKTVLDGCKCGGIGLELNPPNSLYENTGGACPDCAEVRALDLCWHEWKISNEELDIYRCVNCNRTSDEYGIRRYHPDLTTHMHESKLWIVHVMQVLGEWDGFMLHVNPISPTLSSQMGGAYQLSTKEILKFADILTDGEHLVPAIEAYLKEREGGK